MDLINTFEGGLNTDSAPERQGSNTYRYLINGVDSSDTGDLLKITSEKGTITFSGLMVEDGWKCIGNTQINSDIILFFVKGNKGDLDYGCRIGIVDYQGIYTTKVDEPLLGFSIEWPIQATARITFENHRVVYFLDNNNPDRRIDLDSTTPFNIGEASLNSNTSLPIVNFIKFNDGNAGNLYTGAYQFIARYLNSDLSTSTFGFLSNPIPVVDDLRSVGRDGYDGAPIDTPVKNKTIQLQLSNLDTSKNSIEIIYIRYVGLGQTAEVKRFYQGNFSSTTLNVEFTGLETLVDVALEEVTVDAVSYISSKTITQKDNRLIRANLKGRTADAIQKVANNIVITYDVEEQLYDQTNQQYFDDYKGEMQTFDKKTYMSEEVYAFSLRVVYTDGSRSLAYHIPAQNPNTSWKSADNYSVTLPVNYDPTTTTLGQKWYPPNFNTQTDGIGSKTDLQMGTYISQLKYENGKDYPSTGINDGSGNIFVRFHLFPPLDIEPHFRGDGTTQYIRYKSIRVSIPDFSILSADTVKDIAGYEILRADRNLDNRSIISQGLIQRSIKMNSIDLGNDTSPYPFGDSFYVEAPGLSNMTVDNDGSHASGAIDEAGFLAAHNFQPDGSDVSLKKYQIGQNYPSFVAPNYLPDLVTYYSPDFILGNTPLSPSSFKEKMIIQGSVIATRFEVQSGDWTTTSKNNFDIDIFCDYNQNNGGLNNKFDTAGQSYFYDNPSQNLENTFQIPFGANTRKIYEHFTTPHYWLRVNGGSLFQDNSWFNLFLRINNDDGGAYSDQFDNTFTSLPITNQKALINLSKNLTQQYGTLGELEYLPIAVIPNKNLIPVGLDGGSGKLRIYNGDIFISKFYVKNSSLLEVQTFAKEGKTLPPYNNRVKSNIDNFPPYKGMPIQSGSYFFVESTVNTNYRHQVPATPPSTATGVPYYPKFDADTSLHTDPKFGHPTGYNLLYSKNNNLKLVPERPLGFVNVSQYPDRIIYSAQAIESEQADSYRNFPVNNFHDIPKNKGEIWNIFVWNNILYAHCPKTLWRTYMNQTTLLTGGYDQANVFVGSGQIFSNPSTEELTLSGGFGGCIDQFPGTNTPSGYVFIDRLQGKVFKLNQGLEEISTKGMQVFFNSSLKPTVINGNYVDNPYLGTTGAIGVYDSYKKRYILTSYHENNSFTVSFSFITNTWRSFHSYSPNCFISLDNRVFAINNKESQIKVYEHNKGRHLDFYNLGLSNFQLDFVITNQGNSNIPDNIFCKSYGFDEDSNAYLHQYFFNTIKAFNLKQNTSEIPIITNNAFGLVLPKNQIKAIEKNDGYKITLPKDLVLNDSLDINDPSNLVSSLPLSDPRWLFRPRIKGNYSIVQLKYVPPVNSNNRFSLNFIKISDRQDTYL